MYYSHQEIVRNQIAEGIKIKVTRSNDSLLMSEFSLRKGALLPEHVHLSDHSAYLLSGKIRIYIDGMARDMIKGDSWCLGKGICHNTEALEDSLVIEVYNPAPEELLQ